MRIDIKARAVQDGAALATNPPELALTDARQIHHLAEFLLLSASEYAEQQRLSPGAVLGAFAMALGRMTGSLAKEVGEPVARLGQHVVRHVQRVASLEFARQSWVLQ